MTVLAGALPASTVFERPEIDDELIDWLGSNQAQYFHLIGPPGSGKTSWLRRLVESGEVRPRDGGLPAIIAAHHFCRRDDAASSSAVGFLQRISQQFADLDPTYAAALLRHAGKSRHISATLAQYVHDSPNAHIEGPRIGSILIQSEKPADVIEGLLKAPLLEALAEPGPLWLLLVDAPDEPQAPDIADLLLALGDLPSRLRIIIATKPHTDMARGLEPLGVRSCSLSGLPGVVCSIARYLRAGTMGTGLERRVTPDLGIEGLIKDLIARAGENFLVARCALQALGGSSGSISAAMVRDLPSDLSGYFRLFLGRLDGETRGRWPLDAGPILGALAVAQAPPLEVEIASLCGISAAVVRSHLTRLLRPFLERVEEKRWRLFHATFAEFLLDEEVAEEFWCPLKEQHDRFIRWVLSPDGTVSDWDDVSDYGLEHILHHVIEASGTDMVRQIDAIVCEAYLRRRIRRGATAFDLSADFKRALIAVSSRGAIGETLFLACLLAYWQDRIAADADPSSTILLAALGKVEEAVKLATRQNDAAHGSTYEGIRLQAEFASGLACLGEIDTAFEFARRLEGEARTKACWAAFNTLVLDDPGKALDLCSRDPFDGTLELHGDAFQLLASHPRGLEPALGAATTGESLVRVSKGCAKHDLDRALELIGDVDIYPWWLGGERGHFARRDGAANVLAAFVEYHPDKTATAWDRASELLGSTWPAPYGLLLAGHFAKSSPELGRLAFERLGLKEGSLAHALAVAWLGALGGGELFAHLVSRLEGTCFAKSDDDEWSRFHDRIGLRQLHQQLALIDPIEIPRESAPFRLLTVFAERLILAMAGEPERPESKARGARTLGKLAGWLGDNAMAALFRLGEEKWHSESWQHECGKGFAAALAHQSVSAYIAARSAFSGYVRCEGAMRIAAEIIARRNPLEMLTLIDSIEVRYFKTRAQLIGTAALAMKRADIGSLGALSSRLSRYVDGAQFQDFVDVLRSVGTPSVDRSDLPEAAVAKKAVVAAIDSDDLNGMQRAVALVEALPDNPGIPFEGETIWAKDLRRQLADALSPGDPVAALRLLVPVTSAEGFKAFAVGLLLREPHFRDPDTFAEWVLTAVRSHKPSWARTHWVTPLATGLALTLPAEARFSFLAAILKEGSPTHARVLADLAALDDPIGTLERATSEKSNDDGHFKFALFNAVQALAERGDETLFERLSRLSEICESDETLMIRVGAHWPTERWEACLSACETWIGANPPQQSVFLLLDMLETLLPRVAVSDPRRAFDAVDRIRLAHPGAVDESNLLRRMIGSVAGQKSPPAQHWSELLAAASRIAEPIPRGSVLREMLSAAKRLPADQRKRPTCQTIAALALGPRELVLNNVEAVVRTAAAADPSVRSKMIGLANRVRALLAVDLNS